MDLVTPGLGLLVWMVVAFLLLVLILGKYGWKPILNSINKRNQSIEDALKSAEHAREEMARLKADNDIILAQAKAERDEILKEARVFSNQIINDAKNSAKSEIEKMKEQARQEISFEKASALDQIKTQVAGISIQIAEKLLKKSLGNAETQQQLVDDIIKDINLN